jgi:ferredoxin-NADP reductase
MPVPPAFEARLVSARPLSRLVRELALVRADGAPFDFEPGQWVNLDLSGSADVGAKKAYSIASAPARSPSFELAVTRVPGGPGSNFLHELEPGAKLGVQGPQGFFTRPLATAAPSLFVATGTGVAPFRSMLLAAVAAKSELPVTLVLGVRHESDLLYRADFEALAAAHPFFRFEPTLSQPSAEWRGRRGYVQSHVEDLWRGLEARAPSAKPHAYVCGLERMVGSVRQLLRKEMGLPREQVHTERYD